MFSGFTLYNIQHFMGDVQYGVVLDDSQLWLVIWYAKDKFIFHKDGSVKMR